MNNAFYGEHGIDKFIRDAFYSDYSYKGTMIEIGAGHPTELSISKHFRDNGWRCICIDANPDYYNRHKELGHEIYNVACSNKESEEVTFYIHESESEKEMSPMSFSSLGMRYGDKTSREIKVKVTTLNSLLDSLGVENVDFLCVDVEGWELEVLDGFNVEKYKPTLIVVENYSKNPDYHPYMTGRGYDYQKSLKHNEVYVRREK